MDIKKLPKQISILVISLFYNYSADSSVSGAS